MASIAFDETCRALGIPNEIKRSYEKKGLKNLYPWQVECLNDTGALRGNNVVYCAPTGGGKTLVAELVLLKTTCALRKKCIFVLPYVSLVVEKHQDIQRILNIYNRSKPKSERVHVKSFHGESKFSRKLQEDILICTIEKANTVVNALISSSQIFQLGCVIIDEMHVIGDASRGYNLEILVSKLKYLQLKANSLSKKLHIQVVALSATISNLPSIATWFNAVLYQTSYRPVPLKENIVSGNSVFDSITANEIRPLLLLSSLNGVISNPIYLKNKLSTLSEEMKQILCLCIEGLRNNQQIIIFCTSRNQCQATAKLLSELLSNINTSSRSKVPVMVEDESAEILFEKRMTTVEKIHVESNNSSNIADGDSPQSILKQSILSGVAFHHAGLSTTERGVVEKAFRKGIISILTATSTLAAGVNLPAGRVIIRSIYFGRDLISSVQYRQMCGRAGRAGLVAYGESFVLTKHNPFERDKARILSTAPIPKIASQMNPWKDNGKALLKVLLELLSLGVCVTEEDVQIYTEQTLMYSECEATDSKAEYILCPHSMTTKTTSTNAATTSRARLRAEVHELLKFLLLAKAIECERIDDDKKDCTTPAPLPHIRVTRFGRAVMESNMNLDEALVIYEDLLQARSQGITLETNLHLLYLVTPLSHSLAPDFLQLCTVLDNARKNKKQDIITLFLSIGIGSREEATMSRWTQQPPSYTAMQNAADNLRHLKIEREAKGEDSNVKFDKPQGSLSEFECQLICKCKRLWAASALNMLVECQSPAQVANTYRTEGKQLTISDVQSLAHNTSILCFRLIKFCREIGWPDFERLIDHVNTDLFSDCLTKEHQALLAVPGMHPKLAKTLVSSGVRSVHDLALAQASVIVQKIQLDMRFEVADAILFEDKLDDMDHGKDGTHVVPSADGNDLTSKAKCSSVAPAAISKDESRRHHLNRFVHSLIDSARNKLETDEALRTEQALSSLESLCDRPEDSDSDEDSDQDSSDSGEEGGECSPGGQRGGQSNGALSPIGSTQDDLESSMEEERCGFMYEQVNWLQNDADDASKNLFAASTNKSPGEETESLRKSVSVSISPPTSSMYDTSPPLSIAAMAHPHDAHEFSIPATGVSKHWTVKPLPPPPPPEDEDITDEAFMMLFDDLDSQSRGVGSTSISLQQVLREHSDAQGNHALSVSEPITAATAFGTSSITLSTSSSTVTAIAAAAQVEEILRSDSSFHGQTQRASNTKTPRASGPDSVTKTQVVLTPSQSKSHQSPYLFPFTPSKRLSPGRFLYLPQVDENVEQPNSAQDAINRHMNQPETTQLKQPQQQSFAWVHMKESNGCNDFLKQLRGCHCIAFELLYSPVPVASIDSRYPGKMVMANNNGHIPVASVLKAWSPLIAWRPSSCLLPANLTANAQELHKDPSEAKVLIGVSFSFGGNTGYYLPLPTIPPLLTLPEGASCQEAASKRSHSFCSGAHINQLSERAQLLICQLVGFHSIFGKCPRLRECLRKNMLQSSHKKKPSGVISSSSTSPSSSSLFDPSECVSHEHQQQQCGGNPLLAVSKLWASRARHALRLDWLAGKCIEWRLCNEIMTSTQITKVAVDMKGKIFSLRERDVLVKGYMEDPQMAFAFLGTDFPQAEKSFTHDHTQQFMLPVPPVVKLPTGVAATPFHIAMVKSCHVAVATMRIMAEQERELKGSNLFETFINIEMPLCITVADAERNGMPVNSDFVTQLRQDIHDRNKMIEYFCQSYKAMKPSTTGAETLENLSFNFDPNSLKEVHRVKSCISKLLTTQVRESFGRWQHLQADAVHNHADMGEGNAMALPSLPPPPQKIHSLWSAGKDKNVASPDMITVRNVTPAQEEVMTNLVDNILATHPLLLLIKEFRAHVRLMPLLQSILNSRFRPYGGDQYGRLHQQELDRVRGVFNTLGTETGRLIVTNPPLQQIPHQCVYTKTKRMSLFSELQDAKAQGNHIYQHLIHRINHTPPAQREWVRMSTLTSKAGSSSCSQAVSSQPAEGAPLLSMTNGIYSSVGGSVGNMSQYSSGKLICILDRNISQSIQCATTKNVLNLLEIWQNAGFSYTSESALQIPIVVVDIKNKQYFYPADQVVRLLAPLLPSYEEAQTLQNASLSLSQPQQIQSDPSSKLLPKLQQLTTKVNADPMFDFLSRQLTGGQVQPEEYAAFWKRHDHLSITQEMHLPEKLEVNPRDGFCASKGYVLMTADYCQIELRILAHFSLDDTLCGAFRDPLSEDIFKCIASRWLGIPVSDVSSEQRSRVKQLTYALLYGAGPGKVAADANCSVSEAETWIAQFLSVYPGIKSFMKEVRSSCAQLGYVQTMLGRRRYLPHIRHAQRKERARAERQAVNTVCQGSAADLIKLAMINIHHTLCKEFKGRNYHARRSVPGGGLYTVLDAVRPVLQIHDELVFEVHQEYVHEVAHHIQNCMENAVELNVPLKVKISVGTSFGSLEPLPISHPLPLTQSRSILCGKSIAHDQTKPGTKVNTSHYNFNTKWDDVSRDEHQIFAADTPSSYETRNRNRRDSGNLQPHPLLVISSAEVLERTSRKRDRGDMDNVAGGARDNGSDTTITTTSTTSHKHQHVAPVAAEQQQELPVARCIFSED